MEQIGEVTAVRGGMLEITFCRPEECEKCHGCAGHHKPSVLEIPGEASVGDAAVVYLPDNTLVKASLLAYVLPVAGLLAGMTAGWFALRNDLAAAGCGVLGFVLLGAVGVLTEKRRKMDPQWQPRVTRIIPKFPMDEN